MNATAPAPAAPPAPDTEKQIAAIADVLGLNPSDIAGIKAAVDNLLGVAAAAHRQLSARERAICAEKRISPVAYIRSRHRLRSGGAVRKGAAR